MKTFYYILILIIGFQGSLFSQKNSISQGNKAYKQLAYINTAEVLEKVADKGYESADLYQKIGNAHYFNRNMKDAAIWYNKLIALDTNIDPEYYFRYAQTLKALEDYKAADYWMNTFFEKSPNDSRGDKYTRGVNSVAEKNGAFLKVSQFANMDSNSKYSDFGATIHNDQLVFASSRGDGPIYTWNNQPFLDLYEAESPENKLFTRVKPWMGGKFNTDYHESSVAIAPNGETIYFTRNNTRQGHMKNSEKNVHKLNLLRVTLIYKGSWSKPKAVHFSDPKYSTAHPTLSKDGKLMVFSSDMPDSKGLADLFVVQVNEDGSLGDPQNLGGDVNTEATESFPFLNESGDLYFSSDGYPGLGGLDVFVIKNFVSLYNSNQVSSSTVQHLEVPINSPFDDFAYMDYDQMKKGYVSSNRPGGKGDDDIYSFEMTDKCVVNVQGVVVDSKTKQKLPYANVTLMNSSGEHIAATKADGKARFAFDEVECTTDFLLRAEKEGYNFNEKRWTSSTTPQSSVEVALTPSRSEYRVGEDLAKALQIENIYFDYDKFYIRYDAEIELQKVLEVLNAYPSMRISIRSHTDCRGTKQYNETLSHERAMSTRNYLISRGISPARLSAKGYGESQPVENCRCSTCTIDQHQANRRSEFIITEL